jgi:hypothetical protein
MSVILAMSNFQVVGCLDTAVYQGAEHTWPHGWKHLLDQGVSFDQVDAEMPSEEMARAYIERFKPK